MIRLAMAVLVLCPLAVQAAPQKSCPPLGVLPDYVPQDAELRSYVAIPLNAKNPTTGETEEVTVAGRLCRISYILKEGADPMSNLEVHMNYRQRLQSMGATIVLEEGRRTVARLTRDGADTWLQVYGGEGDVELITLQVQPPKVTLLPASGNDYKLLGHMPDFVAAAPTVRNYDTMTFPILQDGEEKEIAAQGRTIYVNYHQREGRDPLANDEINFNYREAFKAMGAEILYAAGRDTVARILKDGQVVWMRAYASESTIEVSVLEEKPFEPSIKPPPPAAVTSALAQTGHVTLYVNFDFDRATLRPDAGPVVAGVVAALKADPKLRLTVEGHTDGIGTAEHNRKLSADRAASFAAALVAAGIPPDRLRSAGFGADKPIATNDTSEGRAKNRRVELVRL